MNRADREEHFLGDSETIMLTHVWGTMCNLSCSFCLNEGSFNLNNKSTIKDNYHITDILIELTNKIPKKFLFIEHGGELLYCTYLHELFRYKVKNIKDYRALFFTNGTSFVKYKRFFDEFKEFIEPYLTFHPAFVTERQVKEYIKCLKYNIQEMNTCNISFVFYEDFDYNEFTTSFEKHLSEFKEDIKIKVFFDKDMLAQENNIKGILKSYRFMKYLDENNYNYKRLLIDDYHKDFRSKSTFCIKEEQRESIISKFMSAIEVVDDTIMYHDLTNDEHKFKTTEELSNYIIDEYLNIEHSNIDVKDKRVINQLVEIL